MRAQREAGNIETGRLLLDIPRVVNHEVRSCFEGDEVELVVTTPVDGQADTVLTAAGSAPNLGVNNGGHLKTSAEFDANSTSQASMVN